MQLRHVLAVLFAFVGVVTCEESSPRSLTTAVPSDDDYIDNSIDLTPTYVSSVERFLQTVLNPFRIFNRADNELEDNLERFILGLPVPFRNALLPRERAARAGFGDMMDRFKDGIHAIYPGTLWCGSGDSASSDDAVGFFSITDTCCKIHDSCSDSISAGREGRGIKNNGIFTRSLCSCDEEFYQCLKDARTIVSTKIGITYFNLLRPQCFKLEYPIRSCRKYASTRTDDSKCLEYDLDLNAAKTWQWFDNPDY